MFALHIDTTAVKQHAVRLGQISKSALPVAVRQTLNRAAYDVKMNTMPNEAARFEHRKPTFFRANSKVVQAQGFDINGMKATVGFVPKPADKSHSVEDLQQQEDGGTIGNRSFIGLAAARSGKAWGKMVKAGLCFSNISDRIVDALDNGAASGKEQFTRSAIHAGKGGFVLGTNKRKGNRFLMYINSVKKVKGKTQVNSTAIYAVKKNRHVHPDAKYNHFMRTASLKSAKKMEGDFIVIANKKIASVK